MGTLLDEASRSWLGPTFVWAATLHLAAIVAANGIRATADIMRQLAEHMDHFGDIEVAKRKAEEAKAQGRLPQ